MLSPTADSRGGPVGFGRCCREGGVTCSFGHSTVGGQGDKTVLQCF
jgi:hypothetical protein